MYGPREPEYDYSCPVCGQGYYVDVGFGLPPCGCSLKQVSAYESQADEFDNTRDADVLDDDDYMAFDPIRAFRLLKELGLLDQVLNWER